MTPVEPPSFASLAAATPHKGGPAVPRVAPLTDAERALLDAPTVAISDTNLPIVVVGDEPRAPAGPVSVFEGIVADRRPWWQPLAIALAAVTALGALLALASLGPQKPPPLGMVRFVLESTPPGATVSRGDERLGVTPTKLEVAADKSGVADAPLRFELEGYAPVVVTASGKGEVRLAPVLQPVAPTAAPAAAAPQP